MLLAIDARPQTAVAQAVTSYAELLALVAHRILVAALPDQPFDLAAYGASSALLKHVVIGRAVGQRRAGDGHLQCHHSTAMGRQPSQQFGGAIQHLGARTVAQRQHDGLLLADAKTLPPGGADLADVIWPAAIAGNGPQVFLHRAKWAMIKQIKRQFHTDRPRNRGCNAAHTLPGESSAKQGGLPNFGAGWWQRSCRQGAQG